MAPDREAYGERIGGRPNPDTAADFLPSRREEERAAVVEAEEADFTQRAGSLDPLPGLLDFVAAARSSGLRLDPVTNAPKDNAYAILRAIGLRDAFDETVLSEEVGVGKPAPHRAAPARPGVTAGEAVAFEDSASGIASAPAAGVPVVGGASTREPEALKRRGAGPAVADFRDPALADPLDGR